MKKFGYIILLILIMPLCSFRSIGDSIKVEQVASDYPIIVRKSNNGIYRISYPLVYRIHNSSAKRYKIRVDYYYGNPPYSYSLASEWSPVFVMRNVNNEIVRATERGRLIIEGLETKEYIVYPGHSVPKEGSLQCLLEAYINKSNSLPCPYKTDTVYYGNTLKMGKLSDFRKAHPDVVNAFLGKDSVVFGFYPLWEKVKPKVYTLPVETDFDNHAEEQQAVPANYYKQ